MERTAKTILKLLQLPVFNLKVFVDFSLCNLNNEMLTYLKIPFESRLLLNAMLKYFCRFK